MNEKRNVETVVIKVDNSKKTGNGKPYQRIQIAEDNLWRSHFGDKLEEGDRIIALGRLKKAIKMRDSE